MELSNQFVVISGCSGGGKSTLLSEFSHNGYAIIPEVGREIVKEQLIQKGNITPWDNPRQFCEQAIERSIAAYHQAEQMILNKDNKLVFFDRSILDGVSYYHTLKTNDPKEYNSLINTLRYYSTVFMAPPWQDIFCNDTERKHSFEEAVVEYQQLIKFYAHSGYNIVELPKMSVKERFKFVISSIS